jgi:sugar-specific transcriptional regulator TrmB
MMNKQELLSNLERVGLSAEEATVFVALLEGNQTHQAISKATDINRTTVYRLVDSLAAKGLAHEMTTDEGRRVASADLFAVELLITEQELTLKDKRAALERVLALAPAFQPVTDSNFSVKTFYGVTGLKQMLWNELRSKSEIVIFSYHTSLNEVAGKRFADKFRGEVMARGIPQRALSNIYIESVSAYTDHHDYVDYYNERFIDASVLPIGQEMTMHDDVVSIYNWDNDVRVGTEIHNPQYAAFMKSIFEHYWLLTEVNQSSQ